MGKALFKITVLNWNKHNGTKKRGHLSTLIANNFCTHGGLGAMPVAVRWLFLGIVLTCGDHTSATVEMGEKQLRALLESSWSITRALDALKELQLLTYEKIDLFINRIEKKGIEKKRIESSDGVADAHPSPDLTAPVFSLKEKPNPELNRKIWEAYRAAYFARYQNEPVRNATVNSQISRIGKRLGEDAVSVVEFFVSHNDGFYLRKVHAIGLCLQDAESLHTQWARGRPVTGSIVRQFERQEHTANLLNMIDRGEI